MNSNDNYDFNDWDGFNDWGWFIDTENILYTNYITNNRDKKLINKLHSIKEECIYYTKNYEDIESVFGFCYKELEKKFANKNTRCLICSATLITSLLTYTLLPYLND